jgi:hypothetical protein
MTFIKNGQVLEPTCRTGQADILERIVLHYRGTLKQPMRKCLTATRYAAAMQSSSNMVGGCFLHKNVDLKCFVEL